MCSRLIEYKKYFLERLHHANRYRSVCKKEVSESEFKRDCKGYSFCSGKCLEEFDRDPAEYYCIG